MGRFITQHGRCLLYEQYGRYYVHFPDEYDMPNKVPIEEKLAKEIISGYTRMNTIDFCKNHIDVHEDWKKALMMDYFVHYVRLSTEKAEQIYQRFSQYEDLRNDFHYFIMNEKFHPEYICSVNGTTAQDLMAQSSISPYQAYEQLLELCEGGHKTRLVDNPLTPEFNITFHYTRG